MTREIYEVYAKVVDANGAYNTLTGYPKTFDSRNYGNDPDKALRRARGEFFETYGAMCKRDDRQMQTVFLIGMNNQMIDHLSVGRISDDPDPEVDEEPGEGE